MHDISAYINSAILKIPFNLFNIISEYIDLNSNVKVAIVGGYVRDLLITKIHKKTFFNPLDIDIVTEGSSVDLANLNILSGVLCAETIFVSNFTLSFFKISSQNFIVG